VALPSVDDNPRDPAADVLHRVVREQLQTFLVDAAHQRVGEGVPRFVEEEFQAFLSCGWLPPRHAESAWRGPRARRRVRTIPVGWAPDRAPGRLLVQGPRICGVQEHVESWGVEAGDVEGFQVFALIRGAIDFA